MATTQGALEKSIFFQKLVLKQSRDPKQKERAKKAIEKLQSELDSMMERKSNPTKRSFSPAQLAAQKLFAERARSGTLKKGKRKANPGLYDNINAKRARIKAGSGERMRKPGSKGAPTQEAFERSAMTAKQNPTTDVEIHLGGNKYGIIRAAGDGYGGQIFAAFYVQKLKTGLGDETETDLIATKNFKTRKGAIGYLVMQGRKTNPDKAKPRAYVKRVSQATGAPPSKRLVTRRKMALKAPAGYFPNPSTNKGLAFFLDAVALGETYSESKLIEALDHPSLSVSDRNVIREALKGLPFNHIKLQDAAMKIRNYKGERKTNPTAPMMTGYQVICMHPKKHVVGIFKTMAEAKQIATAMANANGVAYGVKSVKVHKAHFAV